MGRLLILLLAAVGGLIVAAVVAFTLVAGTYRAPSESMVPTLNVGSRFTVLKFVQRVVAVGGDRISLRGGKVMRNGKVETTRGPVARDGEGCEFPREITVPKGHLFLLGDHRGAPDDSRFWGPVPEKWLVGKLWFVYKN